MYTHAFWLRAHCHNNHGSAMKMNSWRETERSNVHVLGLSSDDGASNEFSRQRIPVRSRMSVDEQVRISSSNRPSPRSCFSNRCRKFRMVVSVGQRLRQPQPTKRLYRLHLVEQESSIPGVAQVVEQRCYAVNTLASPTADNGYADRARFRIRTARSVAPAAGKPELVPSSQGTTHAASGASSSRAPVPQSLTVP